MPIRIQCPSATCRATCSAKESVSGRTITCPKCGKPYVATPTLDGGTRDTRDTQKSRPALSLDPFPTLPAEFGRYRVLKLLGRGGMGAVYLAHDSQLGRQVALKIPFIDASKTQRLERFAREARAAAALKHPNICTVFDTGAIDGRPFITMEYVEGTPLEQEVGADVLMPVPRAVEIVRQVALGLEYAHRKGIVHRDLKPANVMIAADGNPVVMDFGLARQVGNDDPNASRLTQDGGILGTPTYMSPEQVKGEPVGPASDVYALGVVLFELLTGTPPYSGPMGNVMAQILASPVPRLAEVQPDADPRLDAICQRAMAKNPADRFPSMAEFADALRGYLEPPAAPSTAKPVTVTKPGRAATLPVAQVERPVPHDDLGEPPPPFDDLDAAPEPVRAPKGARVTRNWRRPAVLALALAVVVPLVVWLAAVVLRVETPNGTLVVEIDDPAVEARIKNGKLILSGPDGKERYTLALGEHDNKLDAGSYKVRVEGADGLVLDTTEFTLKKGERVAVRVKIEPKVVAKNAQPKADSKKGPSKPELEADRRAAEYVLKVGGVVRVDDDVDDIRSVAGLPQRPFRLTSVDIDGREVKTADFAAFAGCRNLKTLRLYHLQVKDEGLANFKDCKSLKILKLYNLPITDAGLANFAGCTELTELVACQMPVGDDGMVHFKDCKMLAVIWLWGTNVGDDGMACFAGCKNITALALGATRITDQAFTYFEGFTELTGLAVEKNRIRGTGLKSIQNCTKLKFINIGDTATGDDEIAHLGKCSQLVDLNVARTKITVKGLSGLQLSKIEKVDLVETKTDDMTLLLFRESKRLGWLRLWGTAVTAKGVQDLKTALPYCDVLWPTP